MKKCTKCNEWKDEREYSKCAQGKGGLKSICKECAKLYNKQYRATVPPKPRVRKPSSADVLRKSYLRNSTRKKELVESLKTNCVKCGENRKYTIHFHHVDPKTKLFDIGSVTSHGVEAIRSEVKKCICLCANCHLEFHHLYGRSPIDSVGSLTEYLDGRLTFCNGVTVE